MKPKPSAFAIPVSTLLLTLLLVATTSAQVQNSTNNNSIAGTWTGMWSSTEGGPKFVLMSQFNADGNFNASETDEFAVTQGVWQRVEPRTVALTAYQFDFPALGQPYDGVFKVNARLNLSKDGESFSGRGHLEFRDPNGVLLFTDDAIMTGYRVHVQPMP
jgi:hypothetical protein